MANLRIFTSPSLMTIGSVLAQILGNVIVLPFILSKFSSAEVTLYLLFLTIFNLQMLIDLGFSHTFSRVIGYAFAGSKSVSKINYEKTAGSPNWELIGEIYATMRSIYLKLSSLFFLFLLVIGTFFVEEAITRTNDPSYWFGWAVSVFSYSIFLFGNKYSSLLIGCNKVALVKKWEMHFSLMASFIIILSLLFGVGILTVIIIRQVFLLLTVFRNRYLVKNFNLIPIGNYKFSRSIYKVVFSKSWKSALGILGSYAVVQFSGIIYSKVGEEKEVASYLLALRIINIITNLSNSPFYSKIPHFNILYVDGRRNELIQNLKGPYKNSLLMFGLLAIIAGWLSQPLLDLIGSSTPFVSREFWSLFILGVFFERYGALHIQIYTITNNIIWHISNSISGIIFIFVSFLFYSNFGMFSFAIAYISANLGFYSWYSAIHSYKEFNMNFIQFEKGSSIIILVAMIVNLVISFS